MIIPNQRLMYPGQQQTGPTTPNQGVINPLLVPSPIDNQQQQQPQEDYSTPILDKLKQMLLGDQRPSPENYKPNKYNRFMANLIAPGNPQAAEYLRSGSYARAAEPYDTRAKQLGVGAEIEERNVTNKRIINQNEQVNAIREKSNEIKQQLGEALNTIKQQQADTSAKKEQDIYDTKNKELMENLQFKYSQLEQAQTQYEGKLGNANALAEIRKAQIDALEAYHKSILAQKDRQLAETTKLHNDLKTKWDAEHKDRQDKVDDAKKPTTRTETLTTPEGKPGGTKTTVTQKGDVKPQGVIKVKNKKTGEIGTIGINKFDPQLYDKVGQ